MRLPAARRFDATILRATITGSDNFISTHSLVTRAMEPFYRTSDGHILSRIASRYW